MGHTHLGVLPGSKKWQQVVELLIGGGSNDAVMQASAVAAERDFQRAAREPVFIEAVRLLLSIPHAARSDRFGAELRKLGLAVGDDPQLFDVLTAAGDRLEASAKSDRGRNDFADLSSRALLSTLSDAFGSAMPGLYEAGPQEVQNAARGFSWHKGISDLTRAFFGQLVARSLGYWLDRTLSARIGDGGRFANVADRSAFDVAINQYAWEATRFIKEFAPGWYGKRLHLYGEITPQEAASFGHVAFKKISEELRIKREPHD